MKGALAESAVNRRLVTTEFILLELGNACARAEDHADFLVLLEGVRANSRITVVPLSSMLMNRGLKLMADRPDKDWSLTDSISFVVMEEEGIKDALTGDQLRPSGIQNVAQIVTARTCAAQRGGSSVSFCVLPSYFSTRRSTARRFIQKALSQPPDHDARRFRFASGPRVFTICGQGIHFETSGLVMRDIKKRNQQILEWCQAGKTQAEISRLFGLSPTRIYQVSRRFLLDQEAARKNTRLIDEIRLVDDLDRQWQADDLLDALRLLAVTRTALGRHLEQGGATTISLRELMDMLVPRATDFDPGGTSPPVLRVCGVGKYGLRSLVNRITDLDLGVRCRHEWQQRLTEIERSWLANRDEPHEL